MKYFSDGTTNASRSLQIYLILIGVASRRETMTYSMLSEKIYGTAAQKFVLSGKLEPLMTWCKTNNLPALTALVVNAETGVPNPGLTTVDRDFPAEQQKVFSFVWYNIFPPSLEELKGFVGSTL